MWQDEEVVALQTAAVTLSNTIARERVFQEMQTSRTETEALYRGSAELNVARTYDGILNVVRNYTALGQGANHITLQLFNRPWADDNEPEFAEVVAHWTTTDTSVLRERYYVTDFPASRDFIQNPSATIIEDAANDARLTEAKSGVVLARFQGDDRDFYAADRRWTEGWVLARDVSAQNTSFGSGIATSGKFDAAGGYCDAEPLAAPVD